MSEGGDESALHEPGISSAKTHERVFGHGEIGFAFVTWERLVNAVAASRVKALSIDRAKSIYTRDSVRRYSCSDEMKISTRHIKRSFQLIGLLERRFLLDLTEGGTRRHECRHSKMTPPTMNIALSIEPVKC